MKSCLVLLSLAVVALGFISFASSQHHVDCATIGGVCKKIGSGSCNEMLRPCKQGFRCCQKDKLGSHRAAKRRKCPTKKKCSRQGGTCVNPMRGDLCYTFGVDNLCKGSSCTCCLSGKSSCRGTPRCKFQGGVCVDSKKSSKFCSGNIIYKKGCKGKKCVCCIPQEKSCLCGITNKPQPTTTTIAPTTSENITTTTKTTVPPIFPWKPKNNIRVVGGTDVMPLNKYPWLVGLESPEVLSNDPLIPYFCTGVIINRRFVLTTAMCLSFDINLKSIKVAVANFNMNSTDDDIPGVTTLVEVKKFFLHEDFSTDTSDNDIALIWLKKPLDLISHTNIKPVCLPFNEDEDYEGDEGVIVGWGMKNASDFVSFFAPQDIPNEAILTISDPDCNGNTALYGIDITSNMLCAGRPTDEGGKAPCRWDSGAPLMVEKDGRHVLVGLTSFGECGLSVEPGTPSIFTRITKYIDWIYDIIDDVDGEVSFCG